MSIAGYNSYTTILHLFLRMGKIVLDNSDLLILGENWAMAAEDSNLIMRDSKGRVKRGSRAINPAGGDMRLARLKNQLDQLTPRAIARLGKLIDSEQEQVALGACRELLDRTLGKPKASLDLKVEASLSTLHLQALEELANRAHAARAERMIDVTPSAKSELTDMSYDDIVVTRIDRTTIISGDD